MNKSILTFVLCLSLYFLFVMNVSAETKYIVVSGDTLWEIAQHNGLTLVDILNSNAQVDNPDLIFPGQIIIIPGYERKSNYRKSVQESRLLELTNAKRIQLGKRPFTFDQFLSEAARLKSIDMKKNEYVSHISPIYGDPSLMVRKLEVPFQNVQENLGAGHGTPEELFSAWMNSTVARAKVLDDKATHIGIGYVEGGLHGHYWTMIIANERRK